jgi:co-chaperonin GroES (HSP10)
MNKVIPVNKSALVEPISEADYLKRLGVENPDDLDKVGGLFVPRTATERNRTPVIFQKAKVLDMSTDEAPKFDLKVGDVVVFNREIPLKYNEQGEVCLSTVKYEDIFCVLRDE